MMFALFFLIALLLNEISGHGMMLEPPNRSSLWRFYPDAVPNYDDNQNYCGGMTIQWSDFNGKCGLCGDVYNAPHPQDNENTGKYGQYGSIRNYTKGGEVPIKILLTTNHMGSFEYSICKLLDTNAPESSEDCFQPIKLVDGTSEVIVEKDIKNFDHSVKLPNDLTCDRCVLRWHYRTGNNWGKCDDGTYAEGCGPQETFRNCADITIME